MRFLPGPLATTETSSLPKINHRNDLRRSGYRASVLSANRDVTSSGPVREKSWLAGTGDVMMTPTSVSLLPGPVMPDAGTITRSLNAAEAQDAQADEELYRLVKDDIQRIARKRKRGAGIDASTIGLVDDAFCRLSGRDETTWQPGGQRKFFSYISKKIHGDLIDLGVTGGARLELGPECGPLTP